MDFNPNVAREKIMSHYMNPDNKNSDLSKDGEVHFSTTCSDKLILKTHFEDDKLTEVYFDGHGCAIFIASTDMLLNVLKNKTKDQIQKIIDIYTRFVMQEKLAQDELTLLEDLWVFYNVKTHLNRTTCALLTANKILNNN